jgi:hypothetical protein
MGDAQASARCVGYEELMRMCFTSFRRVWAPAVVAFFVCAGCGSKPRPPEETEIHVPDQRMTNEQTLEMNFRQQTRNGTAIGGTVYPHHFIINDAKLTMVGQRQVNALLPRNEIEPVRISVPRGTASDALYEARLQTLRDHFAAAGFGEEHLAFVDELPGGDGIWSDRVMLIATEEPRPSGTASGSGSSWGPGSGRGSTGGGGSGGSGGNRGGGGGGSSSGGGSSGGGSSSGGYGR